MYLHCVGYLEYTEISRNIINIKLVHQKSHDDIKDLNKNSDKWVQGSVVEYISKVTTIKIKVNHTRFLVRLRLRIDGYKK